MRLSREIVDTVVLLAIEYSLHSSAVVAPRIELSATALSGPFGQPVLDYRINRDGRIRTDVVVLPRHAGRLYPTSRFSFAMQQHLGAHVERK